MLRLPGFSRAAGSGECADFSASPPDTIMDVSWDEDTTVLTIRASTYTLEETKMSVTVSAACGIRLPIAGVALDSPVYTRALFAAGKP